MTLNLMLNASVEGGTALVTCRGAIVHGATARRFRAGISRLLRCHRRVVLDLGAVTHIDARGVGTLAVLIARAKSADRQLVLARASARVERVLRLTRLDVELYGDSVSDRNARPSEPEVSGEPEHAVVRSHVGPSERLAGSEPMTDEQIARREVNRGELAEQLRTLGSSVGVQLVHTSFRGVRPIEGGQAKIEQTIQAARALDSRWPEASWLRALKMTMPEMIAYARTAVRARAT